MKFETFGRLQGFYKTFYLNNTTKAVFFPADKMFLLYTDRSPYSFRLDRNATGFWVICSGYLQLAKEIWDKLFVIKESALNIIHADWLFPPF